MACDCSAIPGVTCRPLYTQRCLRCTWEWGQVVKLLLPETLSTQQEELDGIVYQLRGCNLYSFRLAPAYDDPAPNVLRFSCRRGALQKLSKKARSRAPKAVSCKRLFGGSRWSYVARELSTTRTHILEVLLLRHRAVDGSLDWKGRRHYVLMQREAGKAPYDKPCQVF